MNKNTFVRNLVIKDTVLDRRYKLTLDDIKEISNKYDSGKSISELAKEYSVSYSRVRDIIDPLSKSRRRASKRAWYYGLSKEERSKKSKQWNKSTKDYKSKIYNIFLENFRR